MFGLERLILLFKNEIRSKFRSDELGFPLVSMLDDGGVLVLPLLQSSYHDSLTEAEEKMLFNLEIEK